MHEITDIPQRYNFHTHTSLCRHAEGTAADYVEAAEAAGLETLGFTEHPPAPEEGIWTNHKLDEDDLQLYFTSLEHCRNDYPGISILSGLELDLYPMFKSYYENEIFSRYSIDYMIGGVHWLKYRGEWLNDPSCWTEPGHLSVYFRELLNLMESGIIVFAAHPDSYMQGYMKWDANAVSCARDILAAAEEYRIPLEINGFGLRKPMIDTPEGHRRKYPHMGFWELAAGYDISVVCSSDAHRPVDVAASLDETRSIGEMFNLEFFPIREYLEDSVSDKTDLNQLSPSEAS